MNNSLIQQKIKEQLHPFRKQTETLILLTPSHVATLLIPDNFQDSHFSLSHRSMSESFKKTYFKDSNIMTKNTKIQNKLKMFLSKSRNNNLPSSN